MERLDPDLMVASRPNSVDPGARDARYRLSHEPDEESGICLDGETSGSDNRGLEELLTIIDETEELVRTGDDLGTASKRLVYKPLTTLIDVGTSLLRQGRRFG